MKAPFYDETRGHIPVERPDVPLALVLAIVNCDPGLDLAEDCGESIYCAPEQL